MKNDSLDLNLVDFKELLDSTNAMIVDKFQNFESRLAFSGHTQQEVEAWFDEVLPESGMDINELLQETKTKVLEPATDNLGLNMYAYVMAGGSQMAIVGDQLASTINQNLGKWHLSPSLTEIEKRVVQWGADIIGYAKNAGGVLGSGGSEANLQGLTIARNLYFERYNIREKGLFGLKPFTVYASKEVHGCVDKSLQLLGIGAGQLRKVQTNADFTINLEALEKQIVQDIADGCTPFCVVGTAGTVNTGAIDDLSSLAEIAKKYSMWFHVDGAYGGLASTLPSTKKHYKGLERADSVAIDFHKWLYQNFEVGCVLVNNWETLRRAYFKKADYLNTELEQKGRLDFNEHTFQLSRNGKALKVWMSLKAYGMQRIRQMIQKDIDLAHYLADEVDKSDDFELASKSQLAVTCFRYTGKLFRENDIAQMNQRLIPALEKDGRVFITGTKLKGKFVLRSCIINHRKQQKDIDYLLTVIRDVAQHIKQTQ